MAAKKTAATDPGPTMTKAAFVRSLPSDMPAKEVVEKAKGAGLELSEGYVYEIRSAAKRAAGKTKGPGRKPGPKPGAPKRAVRAVAAPARAAGGESKDLEARFIDAALDLGLSRASELLDRVRARVKGLSV